MASKLVAFIAIQGILLQTVYSQCVNRVLPNLGPNVVETILPLNPSPCGGSIIPQIYQSPIISGPVMPEVGYPAIVQDSSVANSLANALQLLVVSNLLSTTLPGPYDVPYPYPYDVMPMPAYNYMY